MRALADTQSFRDLIESHPECKECIPVLTREMAIEAFNQTKMKIKRDEEKIER